MKKYLFITLFVFFIAGFLFWNVFLPRNPSFKQEAIFSIEKGQGSREIALNLEKQGLIRWSSAFRIYVATKGISGKLQAGSYPLSPSMTVPQMAEKFYKGDVIKIELVVPEGYNLKDIERVLASSGKNLDISSLKADDFKKEFGFLESVPVQASLEGFLFPDTYEFSYDAGEKEIVWRMLDNFDKKIPDGFEGEIVKQKKTIFNVVTMASLIEKEAKTKQDKQVVSGILWKRLRNKIPLQVDATINYITQKQTTKVSIEETKLDSPYNTYKYLGLPVGPVCNPGLESIEAAVYPLSSAYWYYLSTPEGEIIFSKTLEEHNVAKFKYLKNNE